MKISAGLCRISLMSVAEVLRRSVLFAGLPDRDIERLADMAIGRKAAGNELLFAEGEPASGFYLLEEGAVKIYKLSPAGKEQILRIVTPGEVFGEAAVFSARTFPAFARATQEGRIVLFPAEKFRSEVKANPELALHMLAVMSRRLRGFADMVENLTLRDVRARLGEYLLNLPADNSGRVTLGITKRALASHLGTQPETLSRALGALHDAGILEVEGPGIRIADPEKLEAVSRGEQDKP